MPTTGSARVRAVLRRHRRHAAGRALAVRRPHQPRARPRAAQEVLPHVQLRAAGRGHRRRDRALARPAPQLPARRGAALRAQRHASRTRSSTPSSTRRCSSPRWRWNLNRALLVLRFRGGRATRRRSSAWRPTTSWPRCSRRPPRARRTSTGPDRDPRPRARAPDHRRHAARGARRRRPARAARGHRVRRGARCTSSTPPSRRCSRTRSSPRGRTRSSTTRSSRTGAPTRCTCGAASRVDLASIGALDPDADRAGARRDHARADDRRRPARPARLARAHRSPTRLAAAVRRARRRAAARSCSNRATVVRDGAARRRAAARRGRRRRGGRGRARPPRDHRHHHRRRLAARHHAPAAPGRGRPGPPRARRLRAPGQLHAGTDPAAVRTAGCGEHRTEWVARRLLARMHSSSRRVRRSGVEPATAQDFMRFLLRWQHVAPGTQLAGDAGLVAAHRAAAGLRGRGGGVGARAAAPARAQLRARHARPPLPRRRGRLAAARAPAA